MSAKKISTKEINSFTTKFSTSISNIASNPNQTNSVRVSLPGHSKPPFSHTLCGETTLLHLLNFFRVN